VTEHLTRYLPHLGLLGLLLAALLVDGWFASW